MPTHRDAWASLWESKMTYRAVLFDLDGTLLDTLEDLADAMNAVLTAEGLPTHPTDAYRHFVGDGIVNLVRRALPADRRDETTLERLVAADREEYARRWDRKTRPYEGVPRLLDGLTGRGLGLAILSNKPDDSTRLCVEKLLPGWSFDAVQGVAEGVPLKPDPAGALGIARRLGVAPGSFLYVGDTATDMRTAVGAGMFPVGALWGFRDADELTAAGAQSLLVHPAELLDLL